MGLNMLRHVIVTIMGNVDSGKSKIIDAIKKTSIVESEPGKITQSIKAYAVSMDAIKKICRALPGMEKIKIPGLLLLDTPGHRAFSTLRKRGGSLADIAILVIDINEGVMPQTIESLEILKETKTPFVVALNKIDLIYNWKSHPEKLLIQNISSQSQDVQKKLETRTYEIAAQLYKHNFNAERFDRIEDYTKQLTLIPTAAKSLEGIPELLMIIAGLAQKFLETSLKYNENEPAKGTILDVLEEKGLGLTIDTIIYDGKIEVGDQIIIGTMHEPIITKVKAMFLPEKNQLKSIKNATAAIGIKIVGQNIPEAIPGMPLRVVNENLEKTKDEIKKEVEELTIELDETGIVIKANSLGSLEGLINILKEKNIKIRKASIGDITKKDISEALADSDQLNHVILGFNVKSVASSEPKIITDNVIYTLIEKFERWLAETKLSLEAKSLKNLTKPCKFIIMPGYIFRQSNPAVFGVEILGGTLKPGTPVFKSDSGTSLGRIKSIQSEGEDVQEAKKGQQIAASMPNITVGRQIKESDVLYSDITENEFKTYKQLKKYLKDDETKILKEIAEIRRKNNPVWGV